MIKINSPTLKASFMIRLNSLVCAGGEHFMD